MEDFKAAGAGQDSIGFITLPASSIFSSMQLRVNDTLLSDSYGCSHYTNYIQHVLNYNSDAIKSRLRLEGFYVTENLTGAVDAAGALTTTSSAYKQLAWLTKLSKVATFISPINHPLAHQARCLPAHCPLTFDFVKSIPAFALWSNKAAGEDRIYKIVDMKLFIKKIRLRPSKKLALETELAKKAASFPMRNCFTKPLFIDRLTKFISFDDVFNQRSVPDLAIVAFCLQTDYRGSYS